MILLDTNVVSEAMKPQPDPSVRAWLNEQAAETLYLSSVTLAELFQGIKPKLPPLISPVKKAARVETRASHQKGAQGALL